MRYLLLFLFALWPSLALAEGYDIEGVKIGMTVEQVIQTLESNGYTQNEGGYNTVPGPTFDELFSQLNGDTRSLSRSSWESLSFFKPTGVRNLRHTISIKFIPLPRGTIVSTVKYQNNALKPSEREEFVEKINAKFGAFKTTNDRYKKKYWSDVDYLAKQPNPHEAEILRLTTATRLELNAPASLKIEHENAIAARFDRGNATGSAKSSAGTGSFDIAGAKIGMSPDQIIKTLTAKGYVHAANGGKRGPNFEQTVLYRENKLPKRQTLASWKKMIFLKGGGNKGVGFEKIDVDYLAHPDGVMAVKILYSNSDRRLSKEKFLYSAKSKYGRPDEVADSGLHHKWFRPSSGKGSLNDTEALHLTNGILGPQLMLLAPPRMEIEMKEALEGRSPTPQVATTF